MLESVYQARLIKRLNRLFPGCVILKNDSGYLQGFPDLTIFFGVRWAILEVKPKRPTKSDYEPNQEWYLEMLNEMSFAACVYPENEKDVLDALQQAFASCGPPLISESQ